MGLLDRFGFNIGKEVGDFAVGDDFLDVESVLNPMFHALVAATVPKHAAKPGVVANSRIRWDIVFKDMPKGKVVFVPGWATRGSAVMNPTANLWHWTAGKPSASRPSPSLNICVNGRSGIPGPLCHGLIDLNGVLHVIASGRANHAGVGNQGLLVRMKANQWPAGSAAKLRLPDTGGSGGALTGWEIENDGTKPLSDAQVVTCAQMASCCSDVLGYGDAQAVGWDHQAWTKRKIDLNDAQHKRIIDGYNILRGSSGL